MKWILGAFVLALVAALAGAAWLLGTEPGLRWAAAQAQAAAGGKLRLEGLRGALASDIQIASLEFQDADTRIELGNTKLQLELLAFLGGRAGIRSLRANSLVINLGPGDGQPPARPDLPLGLRIDSASVARIAVQRGEARYVVENFQLADAFLHQTGAISASSSFVLPHDLYPANVALRISGTIERIDASLSGTVAGMPASIKALLTPFAARIVQSIDAEAGPADLSKLNSQWPHTSLNVALSGKASADTALAGTLSARNTQAGPIDKQRLPIASVDARFATDFDALSLEDLRIGLSPGGALSGKGEARPGRATFDLRAAKLDLRGIRSDLRHTQLDGPLKITLAETQSVQGTLAQAGMSLSADVVRKGDVLDIRSLRAAAEGGEATGTGRVHLAEPMRFEARLKLARFNPARFGEYPGGSIGGSVQATGTLGKDLQVDARWLIEDSTLEGLALSSRGAARVSRKRATQVNADARLGGARLTARGDFGGAGDALALGLEAPRIDDFIGGIAGSLRANGTLRGTWEAPRASLSAQATALRLPNGIALKSAALEASGSLLEHTADLSLQADGLDLEARLRGGWRKEAGWEGEVQTLRNRGPYPMQLTAAAPLKVSPGRVELGRLDTKLADGRLLVKELAWSDKGLASSGEFSGLPAQWLVLAAGLSERLRSTLLVDGQWSLASTPRLTGTASVRRAAGDLTLIQGGPVALGLDKAALDMRFSDGRMDASADVTSRYATVALKGSVMTDPDAEGLGFTAQSPLAFEARLAFAELRVLTQSVLTDARLEGRVGAELRGGGTLGSPTFTGKVNGEAIALDVPPYGVFLKDGRLRAVLEGDALRVTEFSIQGGEGHFTASGTLPLPLRLADGGAHLAWKAEKFGLLQRPNLRLVVSGAGEARMAEKRILLSGALRADRGHLELEQQRLPQLGDDVVIVGQERAVSKESARLPVALDVQLDLGDDLQVRGYGLEGRLAGQVHVQTTKEGELRAYGRIHTVNATFLAYGQRLQVDPGVAIFDGPLDNPSLQMTAWRRNQQVEAGVQVSGTARSPRVQLVSQPPVPEGERLSWLVLGRAPGEATKADLGLLQAAAGALLARGDQMPLDRRIARAFGVDEISLRGSGEVADRVVAVGKRLSDQLYVSYEQGIGAVASALVKLDFSLTQRVSVRAETGTSSGIGLFYRFSWD